MGSLVGAIAGPVIGGLLGADAAGDAADTQAAAADRATQLQKEMFDKQVELQAPFREAGLTANNQLMYLLGLGSGGQTMSYDQLRQELAPQFTTTTTTQGTDSTNPMARFFPRVYEGTSYGGTSSTSTTVDEAALRQAIEARLRQQQQAAANAQGDPAFGSLMRRFSMQDFEADPGYQFRMDEGMRALEGSAAARGGLLSGAAMKAIQKYGQGVASQEYGNAYNRYTADQTNQYNRLAGLVNTGMGATNQTSNAAANFANNASSNIIGAGNAAAAGQIGTANALVGGINSGINAYQNNQLMQMIQQPSAGGTYGGSTFTPSNYSVAPANYSIYGG